MGLKVDHSVLREPPPLNFKTADLARRECTRAGKTKEAFFLQLESFQEGLIKQARGKNARKHRSEDLEKNYIGGELPETLSSIKNGLTIVY